ncbi:MAG: MAPEG family protein [Alphaproteobacteria bacterium]|nr:MAPEG family protein [Alphaproteobacteria bacterium]
MTIPILTATYGAVLALILVGLSVNVIRLRVRHRVSLGDGGVDPLRRAIRGQGNFSEYVPLTLILMLTLELLGQPAWLIHAAGGALLVGRIVHGVCFACFDRAMGLRRAGMALTFAAILIAALGNLAAVLAASP